MKQFLMALMLVSSTAFANGVQYVEADDKEMAAAMDKAKQEVDQFIQLLNAPDTQHVVFAIKVGFAEGDKNEYMWLEKVKWQNDKFVGQLKNSPVIVKAVRKHQWVSTLKSQVVDWMVVRGDGSVQGAYTTRLLRQRMTAEDRSAFDEQTGLNFGDAQ